MKLTDAETQALILACLKHRPATDKEMFTFVRKASRAKINWGLWQLIIDGNVDIKLHEKGGSWDVFLPKPSSK